MTKPLDGLEDIDWPRLHDAYGSAEGVPDLLRSASVGDSDAWFGLCSTVWHQGTVYEVTPVSVPFLVQLAIQPRGNEPSRTQAAFLLASIAAADSFVLPTEPRVMQRPSWLRGPGEPVPSRDLVGECNAAVATGAPALAEALDKAPRAARAGLIAALGAVGSSLSEPAQKLLAPLVRDSDVRVNTAVALTLALASGKLTPEHLQEGAQVDEEAREVLEAISDWPEPVRAVELIRELCERVASDD